MYVLFATVCRDTPRKRAGAAAVASATSRSVAIVSGGSTDPQLEEVVDENFPVRKTECVFVILHLSKIHTWELIFF